MNKSEKKQVVFIMILIIGLVTVIIGTTYAYFSYRKVGETNNVYLTGDLYLNLDSGTDTISLNNVLPESIESARSKTNNFITFTIHGKNTSPEAVYYALELVNGVEQDGKTRLNPSDLMFDLVDITGGTENYLLDAVSFSDFNNHKIWADTVNTSTLTEISRQYKLRAWLSEKVLISETDPTANYTPATFRNSYASVKLNVDGALEEKALPLTFTYNANTKEFALNLTNFYPSNRDGETLTNEDIIEVRITNPTENIKFGYTDTEGHDIAAVEDSLRLVYTYNTNSSKVITLKTSAVDESNLRDDVHFVVLKNGEIVQSVIKTLLDLNDVPKIVGYVTYETGDESLSSQPTQPIYENTSNTIKIGLGKNFLGWSTTEGSKTAEYNLGDTINFNSDTTLYAVYEQPQQSLPTIESCPDCVFAYNTDGFWTTWNTNSQTPTVLTSSDYKTNYEDVITESGKNYFLGLKLNSNNEITNAYVCGVKDGTPFCIEGTSDGSKYTANQILLQGANIYNNTCNVVTEQAGTEYEYQYTDCGPWDNSGSVSAHAHSYGDVGAGVDNDDHCGVNHNGTFGCRDSDSGGG